MKQLKQIINRTIKDLKQINVTLSGDDSGLTTIWDEVCAQVRSDNSFYWDGYIDTINKVIQSHMQVLPVEENSEEKEYYDDCDFQTDYLLKEIRSEVLTRAQTYHNSRVNRYLAFA